MHFCDVSSSMASHMSVLTGAAVDHPVVDFGVGIIVRRRR